MCVLHSAFYNMLNNFFCKTLYVPQLQKLYASVLKPSAKKSCLLLLLHTVAILKSSLSKSAFVIFFRETFRSDYEALKERLTTLPDKTTHDVMVTGFHLKSIAMLHIFFKKFTIQALDIFFKVEGPDKKRRYQLACTFTFL